jgi:threonine/homoserine/homoserine lactone efflux protein
LGCTLLRSNAHGPGLLFIVSLTPGQAAAFCVAVGMEDHDRSALWAPVGVTLGKLVHLIAAALGAAWLLDVPEAAKQSLLLAAAGYLLWQGIRHLRHRAASTHHRPEGSGSRSFHTVADGFFVSVANPESVASSLAILPLFAPDPATFGPFAALLTAGAVAVLIAYFFYEAIAAILSRHVHEAALNRIVGIVYLVAALAVVILAFV